MKGLAVLTGDIGTGKTLLARRLLDELSDDEYEVSMLVVLHGQATSDWLISRIAAQFGVEHDGPKHEVVGRLYKRLVEISEEGKKAVIIIDEAQMLRGNDLLEELRGLLNLDLPDRKLITFILVGMPDLDNILKQEPALAQRMAVRCELHSLTREITEEYVKFRLLNAGSGQQLFSKEALDSIYEYAKGNPRLINVICDNALFEGFIRKASLPLPEDVIDGVAADLGLNENI